MRGREGGQQGSRVEKVSKGRRRDIGFSLYHSRLKHSKLLLSICTCFFHFCSLVLYPAALSPSPFFSIFFGILPFSIPVI